MNKNENLTNDSKETPQTGNILNHPLFLPVGSRKLLALFIKPENQTKVIKIDKVEFNKDRTLTIQSYEPTEYFEKYFKIKLDNVYIYQIPIDDVSHFSFY